MAIKVRQRLVDRQCLGLRDRGSARSQAVIFESPNRRLSGLASSYLLGWAKNGNNKNHSHRCALINVPNIIEHHRHSSKNLILDGMETSQKKSSFKIIFESSIDLVQDRR